jgi:hypothetical protein
MQSMHQVRLGQADAYRDGKLDENAARKSIDSVLTPEQRKQLGEGR